ncbi:MAG: serine/threonine-protein kinase [Thermoguttaceae bacterium]|jgi:serine/threonine protein kinase|nr:serine/threonine-protein kinase [Thermoguttaceae bacterium]
MTRIDSQVRAARGPHAWNTSRLPLRLGGWELLEQSAEGEFARVYRARPAEGSPDRPAAYALKVLRPEWESHPQAVALLAREAQLGRRLSHPHLVSVLAARVREAPRYLVMPWLDGKTLGALLKQAVPPELPEVLWIARQTAEALAALHSLGWMHGDVKSENLLVSPTGHVTLLDLGFARRRNEEVTAADRIVTGTCAYLAPELLHSRLRADIRSDLYSLGVVLFEALSGRLPYSGQTLVELIEQHQRAAPPDLGRFNPQIPGEVVDLVRRLLAKDPLRRPQNPRDLVAELVQLEIATFGERSVA